MTRGDTRLDTSAARLPGEEQTHGGMEQATSIENQSLQWTDQQGQPQINVGDAERAVSVAAGAIAAMAGLGRGGLPGLLITAIGGGLIYRATT